MSPTIQPTCWSGVIGVGARDDYKHLKRHIFKQAIKKLPSQFPQRFSRFQFVWLDQKDWIEFRRSIHLFIFVKSCLNLSSNFLVLCVSFAWRRLETFLIFLSPPLVCLLHQIGMNIYIYYCVAFTNFVSLLEMISFVQKSVFPLLFWLDAERSLETHQCRIPNCSVLPSLSSLWSSFSVIIIIVIIRV